MNEILGFFQNIFAPPRHMILLVIAAWLGLSLAERYTEKHKVSKEDLNNIAFYGLIAYVLGGRLFYVFQNFSAFSKSPLGMISINPNLFDPTGAVIAAALVMVIYAQQKKIDLWNMLDALSLFFAVITVGVSLSHFAAGTAFGTSTTLPWGIDLWNQVRHPNQMYEALASLFVLFLIWRFNFFSQPGVTFLLFAALSAFTKVFLLGFRASYTNLLHGYRLEQVAAWIVLFLCFLLIENRLGSPRVVTQEH